MRSARGQLSHISTRCDIFLCHSLLKPGGGNEIPIVRSAAVVITRYYLLMVFFLIANDLWNGLFFNWERRNLLGPIFPRVHWRMKRKDNFHSIMSFYHADHIMLFLEDLLCFNWFLLWLSLPLQHGVLDHSCDLAGSFSFMYWFSFTCILSLSNFDYSRAVLHFEILCRRVIGVGRKVAHVICWLVIFDLCSCGREWHSYAGICCMPFLNPTTRTNAAFSWS